MYTQDSFNANEQQLNNKLDQLLRDDIVKMKEQVDGILHDMDLQAEAAINDVHQHINKLINRQGNN